MNPLARSFYERPPLEVARDMLGMHLCHILPSGEVLSGRIVEVEAYAGPEDRASHARLRRSRGGRLVPTERSALMFGPAGVAYVYLIYGMHSCVNAVAHAPSGVGAVLIRALEPEGSLAGRRTSGPALLCAAMGIDRRHNGRDLCQAAPGGLLLCDRGARVRDADVVRTARIGVAYAGEDALLPHRLYDRLSAHVSRR